MVLCEKLLTRNKLKSRIKEKFTEVIYVKHCISGEYCKLNIAKEICEILQVCLVLVVYC